MDCDVGLPPPYTEEDLMEHLRMPMVFNRVPLAPTIRTAVVAHLFSDRRRPGDLQAFLDEGAFALESLGHRKLDKVAD